jgi:hypothetical protein
MVVLFVVLKSAPWFWQAPGSEVLWQSAGAAPALAAGKQPS